MGWVELIDDSDDMVYLLEYKEEGNDSTSFDDTMVSFIVIPVGICCSIDLFYSAMKFMSIG